MVIIQWKYIYDNILLEKFLENKIIGNMKENFHLVKYSLTELEEIILKNTIDNSDPKPLYISNYFWVNYMIDVKKLCRDKGLRMTEQRNIIADVITEMSANGHPDVNEIFLNANEQDKNISIATVYRTVKLFEEYGAIEKHEFKDGRSRYEAIEDHHHDHLIDIESGEIHEFTNEEIEEIQRSVAKSLGYRLIDHRLELYGIKIKKNN